MYKHNPAADANRQRGLIYSKVYNYLHNLTFGQFQNTTINVRGAMNCATTNAANPKESV